MKQLICFLILLAALGVRAASYVTASVTITNLPVNTNTMSVNGVSRNWATTVTNAATQWAVTNSIGWSLTNLVQQISVNQYVGIMAISYGSASNFTLQAMASTNLSITFGGSGWARVTYSTNTTASTFNLVVPSTGQTNQATVTNIWSLALTELAKATNPLPANSPGFVQFLSTNINPSVFPNVRLTNVAITGGGLTNAAITNAPSISGSNIALVSGTLTNVTERMSTNINPVITAARGISGTNTGIIGGSMTNVTATNFTLLGGQSYGVTNMDQIWLDDDLSGNLVVATLRALYHTNVLALDNWGWPIILKDDLTGAYSFTNAMASSEHVLTVGYATQLFPALNPITGNYPFDDTLTNFWTIPNRWTSANIWFFGGFTSTNATNFGSVSSGTTLKGLSTNSGSWTETSTTISSLANGNNRITVADTDRFVKLSGPSADHNWNSLTNGWTDRVIELKNDSGYNATLVHESGFDSSPVNRFACISGLDTTIATNTTVILKYLSSRWTVIGGSALNNTNVYATPSRTNEIVMTNGVILGALTNGGTIAWDTGVTGYVATAGIVHLGVTSASVATNYVATTNGISTSLTNRGLMASGMLTTTNITTAGFTNSGTTYSGLTLWTGAATGHGIGNGSIFTFFNQGSSGNYDEVAFYRSDSTLLGMMTFGYGTGAGTPALMVTNGNIFLGNATRTFNSSTTNSTTVAGLRVGFQAFSAVITNIFTTNVVWDFPSTSSGAVADLGATITGVKDGDEVTVSPPQAAMTGIIGFYTGFASNGVAYGRFVPTAATQDPASGTFRVVVTQYR